MTRQRLALLALAATFTATTPAAAQAPAGPPTPESAPASGPDSAGATTPAAAASLDPPREYRLEVATDYDLHMAATNGITAFRAAQDAFTHGVRPHLPEGVQGIAAGAWSFAATYLAMVWSHEFGHVLRAAQVGGEFRIHDVALPIPNTTMHLPPDVALDEEALSITGGFEVNALSARTLRQDFLRLGALRNDDLALAFAHRLMFPLYVSVIIPQDPADPDTWITTGGDPVHFMLPVWEAYADGQVFTNDGDVAPGLVDFYGRAALLGTLWNFLDPGFYQQLLANFGDVTDTATPWWAVDTGRFAWSWGTLFNTSPLGYELYLENHFRWNGPAGSDDPTDRADPNGRTGRPDRLLTVYGRVASPFDGRGIGVIAPAAIRLGATDLGLTLEAWDQDRYGTGWATFARLHHPLASTLGALGGPTVDRLALGLEVGWKDTGYLLGRPLDRGPLASVRVTYTTP